MNILNFLDSLSYEQLQYCKREVEKIITQTERVMVHLWVVSDNEFNYGWFKEDDYQAAVDCMVSQIRREASEGASDIAFYITKCLYRKDEVDSLLRETHENNF